MNFRKKIKPFLLFSFWGAILLATNSSSLVSAISLFDTKSGNFDNLFFEKQTPTNEFQLFSSAYEENQNENDDDDDSENDDDNVSHDFIEIQNPFGNIIAKLIADTAIKKENELATSAALFSPLPKYTLFCCWKHFLA